MIPFDLLSCSWPRPVTHEGARWRSEPEWDAPLMRHTPRLRASTVDGEDCWRIDWCDLFSHGLCFHSPRASGEMRGFHVVFRIRVRDSGVLIFWDDDGSIVRSGGRILHEDRECHALTRHQIPVRAGECLDIAHWQSHGEWIWAARLEPTASATATLDIFRPYLPAIQSALRTPDGPPLKMYVSGSAPARSILCAYSMVLNGYAPSGVHLFGDYQWTDEARTLFRELFPFAVIVPSVHVRERLEAIRPELGDAAFRSWSIMKLAIGLLHPPHEYCFLDDDVFILDSVNEAALRFRTCDLVYAPDADYSEQYGRLSAGNGDGRPLPTGNLNTGLYWLRNSHNPSSIAARILNGSELGMPAWQWEQGVMAVEFANEAVHSLPAHRYFYPYFDGLPQGITGYDYARNPCGFVSVHFGGLAVKPSDADARVLAADILTRRGHHA